MSGKLEEIQQLDEAMELREFNEIQLARLSGIAGLGEFDRFWMLAETKEFQYRADSRMVKNCTNWWDCRNHTSDDISGIGGNDGVARIQAHQVLHVFQVLPFCRFFRPLESPHFLHFLGNKIARYPWRYPRGTQSRSRLRGRGNVVTVAWTLLCAFLVVSMQLGFAMVEAPACVPPGCGAFVVGAARMWKV